MAENFNGAQAQAPKKDKGRFFRKILIKLKYTPNIVPLLVLIVGYVVLSLNLLNISETTLYIGKQNMGLYAFVSYLLSILSLVCLLNSFPKREPTKLPFLILTFVLLGLTILMDILYINLVSTRISELKAGVTEAGLTQWAALQANNPTRVSQMLSARTSYVVHIVFVAVGIVLLALLPVIRKLMKKINTRVALDENEHIADISLSDDDDSEGKRSGGKRNQN